MSEVTLNVWVTETGLQWLVRTCLFVGALAYRGGGALVPVSVPVPMPMSAREAVGDNQEVDGEKKSDIMLQMKSSMP
jgi:hypothetical protein